MSTESGEEAEQQLVPPAREALSARVIIDEYINAYNEWPDENDDREVLSGTAPREILFASFFGFVEGFDDGTYILPSREELEQALVARVGTAEDGEAKVLVRRKDLELAVHVLRSMERAFGSERREMFTRLKCVLGLRDD